MAVFGFDGNKCFWGRENRFDERPTAFENYGTATAETFVRFLEKKAVPFIKMKFNTELIAMADLQ